MKKRTEIDMKTKMVEEAIEELSFSQDNWNELIDVVDKRDKQFKEKIDFYKKYAYRYPSLKCDHPKIAELFDNSGIMQAIDAGFIRDYNNWLLDYCIKEFL